MPPLKKGDKFPSGVVFDYVPIEDKDLLAAGMPQDYNASEEFRGKKVVLVSAPGAFTPACSAYHLPPYAHGLDKLKAKGVDEAIFIASNDGWVMSAWGKANGLDGNSKLKLMGDSKTRFSHKHAWDAGVGDRNGRWAMIIEKDGTVSYAENEPDPAKVTVSGLDDVLAHL